MRHFGQHIFSSPLDTVHEVRIPWKWMPTLFVSKGLAYATMFLVSLVAFKRLGLSNGQTTFLVAWLMLPCVMRPLLALFVQTGHRNRMWIMGTELLTTLSAAGIGYAWTTKAWLEGSVCCFWIMAFANVFHDIATDKFSLRAINHQHVSSLRHFKLTFYLLALLVATGIVVMIAGNLEVVTRTVNDSWSTAFYIISGLLLLLLLWHAIIIPHTTGLARQRNIRVADMFYACLNTTADLVRTPSSWPGVLFLAFFLLPCTLLTPVSILFLIDPGSSGGLGLAPQEFGYVLGTVGVFGLTAGGISGHWILRRTGLNKALPLMTTSMTIPPLVYIYLSFALPANVCWIACCIFVQQLFCAFGASAYLQYLVYYSEVRRFSTYALCLSLACMAGMIPVMVSGSLQLTLGYRRYFMFTALCTVATVITSAIVLSDRNLDGSITNTNKQDTNSKTNCATE